MSRRYVWDMAAWRWVPDGPDERRERELIRSIPNAPRRLRRREGRITAIAMALYDAGLHSVGPDDLDNRQLAARMLDAGDVAIPWRRLHKVPRVRWMRREGC